MKKLFVFGFLILMCAVLKANPVPPGTDYLATDDGTQFYMPGLGGMIALKGNPIGLSPNTNQPYDTVVQRLETAHIDEPIGGPLSDVVHTKMTALSLESVNPVYIGDSFFDVFVDLNPTSDSNGSMTIRHENKDSSYPTGTFDSFFDVYFDVYISPVGSGVMIQVAQNLMLPLSSYNNDWIHGTTGFWVPGMITEEHPDDGRHNAHMVDSVPIPEPATILLFALGALAIRKKH